LVGSEIELAGVANRERRLKDALTQVESQFQFVFLDCPPSLGLVTLNAFVASQSVVIPLQCEYYALEGLTQLVRTIDYIKERFNPTLAIEGILFTMFDGRSNLSRQVKEEVERHFPHQAYRTMIPRNVRLADAPGFGKPGVIYDPQSVGARAYKLLADEFLQNNNVKAYRVGENIDTTAEMAGVN
jgi:chromosome partitioning protein